MSLAGASPVASPSGASGPLPAVSCLDLQGASGTSRLSALSHAPSPVMQASACSAGATLGSTSPHTAGGARTTPLLPGGASDVATTVPSNAATASQAAASPTNNPALVAPLPAASAAPTAKQEERPRPPPIEVGSPRSPNPHSLPEDPASPITAAARGGGGLAGGSADNTPVPTLPADPEIVGLEFSMTMNGTAPAVTGVVGEGGRLGDEKSLDLPVFPASPTPFLSGRHNRGLLTWWEKLQAEMSGTPAVEAVSVLGRNFQLDRRRKIVNTVSSIFAGLAIVIAITNQTLEQAWAKSWDDDGYRVSGNGTDTVETVQLWLDASLTFITVCHIVLLVKLYLIWYHKECLLKRDYRELYTTFTSSPSFPWLICHALAVAVHAPPYLAEQGRYVRTLNIFVLLRGIECLNAISHYTFVGTAGSALVAALANQQLGPFFVYKMLLFKYPILTISLSTTAGFLLLSFIVWFVEGPSDDWTIFTSMWYTIVTFTTVGYGDSVPASAIGKFVGVVSAIFGITASAVLVSVVQHKLALTRVQKQIIMFLCEVQSAHRIKEVAAEVICRSMQYNALVAQWRRTSEVGEPVPDHRSITGFMALSSKTRILHASYMRLSAASQALKRLRSGEDGGNAWADISVLDVLHADTSDILAQNTVLQHLMNTADESISSQLKQNKRRHFVTKTGSGQHQAIASLERSQHGLASHRSVAREVAPVAPEADAETVALQFQSVSQTSQADPEEHAPDLGLPNPNDDDSSSVHSGDTDVSLSSMRSGARTQESTKMLVDMVRFMVQDKSTNPTVPFPLAPPPPRVAAKAETLNSGGLSPSRHRRRSPVGSGGPPAPFTEGANRVDGNEGMDHHDSSSSLRDLLEDGTKKASASEAPAGEAAKGNGTPKPAFKLDSASSAGSTASMGAAEFRAAARKVIATRRVVNAMGGNVAARRVRSTPPSTALPSAAERSLAALTEKHAAMQAKQDEQGAMLAQMMQMLQRMERGGGGGDGGTGGAGGDKSSPPQPPQTQALTPPRARASSRNSAVSKDSDKRRGSK